MTLLKCLGEPYFKICRRYYILKLLNKVFCSLKIKEHRTYFINSTLCIGDN